MNTSGLLDTSVVIEAGMSGFDEDSLPAISLISSVTLGELSTGPLLASTPNDAAKRLRRLQATEQTYAEFVLPYDAAAARVYGTVVADVVQLGRSHRRRISDLQIAAIAIANALPLYTINVDDFRGIRDLEVVRVPPAD